MKIEFSNPRISRQYLANKNIGVSYKELLKRNKSVNLKGNSKIIDLGNGYAKIISIDPNNTL